MQLRIKVERRLHRLLYASAQLLLEMAAPLPGAMELMRGLYEAGFRQALASSTPIENIELISEVLGLKQYLTVLVSGETVPHGKPAPDIFLQAAKELGVDPEKVQPEIV